MNCNRSSWTKQVQKRIQTFAADQFFYNCQFVMARNDY